MSGWKDVIDKYGESGGAGSDGIFLRIESGESARVVIDDLDDVYVREQHWVGGKAYRYDAAKHTGRPTVRTALNCFSVDQGKMMVFDAPISVFRQLTVYAAKGTLPAIVLEISRSGAGLSTKWKVTYDSNITPDIQRGVDAAKRHVLREVIRPLPEGPPVAPAADGVYSEKLPF